ncbi:MAG: PD-(D/E)XK nuclease family protein, partial [Leptotrichiaceae bacterium]|nr:PD-(D/E)XK nuclease family protein [Leptotrichiaceae bacterium]
DPITFGNIIHLLYEKIIMENKEALERGKFTIKAEEIESALDRILDFFEYRMPKEYMVFYKKISFQEIMKSAGKFLKELTEELNLKNNVKIYSEEKIKMKTEKGIYENAYINGVADLHIQADDEEILIDYKSGKDNRENENRAFNQLDYYSEMLPGKERHRIRKWIINTWSGEKITDEKRKTEEILTEKDIRETVKEYYEREYCNLGKKKDTYFYRKYKDICRRADESDERNK